MKEFYLVPAHEMDEIRNKSHDSKEKINPYPVENKLFNNENLSKETVLEIKQQMDRLRSEIQNNISAKKEEKIPNMKNENPKHLNYMKAVMGNTPSGLELVAMKTIEDLEKNGVILTVNGKYAMLKDGSGDEVSLRDLIRAIFVRNAKVSHIKEFLTQIIGHINMDNIRNDKLREIGKRSKSFKEEPEDSSQYNNSSDEEGDVFHDSVLQTSGGRLTNSKVIPWITYH